jgi:hypothetical protein
MEHLYASVVRVLRPALYVDPDGSTGTALGVVDGMGYVPCRIDLNFMRPGKDIAPAPVAGRAPDRIGILFCNADIPIRSGDTVEAIPNDFGVVVVPGTFEVRVIPDVAVGFSVAHHQEIQILETGSVLPNAWQDANDSTNK